MKKKFKVSLFKGSGELVECVEVVAKGKSTARRIAKFKSPVGWEYSIRAEQLTTTKYKEG